MNYIDKLAAFDWLNHRMLPVNDQDKPIIHRTSQINVDSIELDNLAKKVELLSETYEIEEMSRIAKKCWEYIKVRADEDPIHSSDSPFIPPLIQCNRVFKSCYPSAKEKIPVICKDGIIEISKAEMKILKRESPHFHEKASQFYANTIKTVLGHLCGEELDERVDFTLIFKMLTVASLLGIDHLAQIYHQELIKCISEEGSMDILHEKILELINFDPSIFIDSLEEMVQLLFDQGKNCDELMKKLPIHSFRIGNQNPIKMSPTLLNLEISKREVTKECLEQLLPLTQLESIKFCGCSFSEDAFEVLSLIKNLKSVTFKSHTLDSEELFKSLGACKNLIHISLNKVGNLTDASLEHLINLDIVSFKLKRIGEFTGTGLEYLNPESLQELKIADCPNLTQEGVEELERFTNLETLKVSIFEGENIEEKLIGLLYNLPLKKLKINHRDNVVPLHKLYTHIPYTLQELDHSVTKHSPIKWSPHVTILNRGSQLRKWKRQGRHSSPLELEGGFATFSFRDYLWSYIYRLKECVI